MILVLNFESFHLKSVKKKFRTVSYLYAGSTVYKNNMEDPPLVVQS